MNTLWWAAELAEDMTRIQGLYLGYGRKGQVSQLSYQYHVLVLSFYQYGACFAGISQKHMEEREYAKDPMPKYMK